MGNCSPSIVSKCLKSRFKSQRDADPFTTIPVRTYLMSQPTKYTTQDDSLPAETSVCGQIGTSVPQHLQLPTSVECLFTTILRVRTHLCRLREHYTRAVWR